VDCTGPVTAAQLVAAINADVAASALVTASLPGGDGSDVLPALLTSHLTGGSDPATFVPDDTTYYETIYGTGSVIQTLPDDTPLDIPGTDYVVKLIARDADGPADPSA
jgi:hypothetical protein